MKRLNVIRIFITRAGVREDASQFVQRTFEQFPQRHDAQIDNMTGLNSDKRTYPVLILGVRIFATKVFQKLHISQDLDAAAFAIFSDILPPQMPIECTQDVGLFPELQFGPPDHRPDRAKLGMAPSPMLRTQTHRAAIVRTADTLRHEGHVLHVPADNPKHEAAR